MIGANRLIQDAKEESAPLQGGTRRAFAVLTAD